MYDLTYWAIYSCIVLVNTPFKIVNILQKKLDCTFVYTSLLLISKY